jgi:hypothetical protein
VAVAALGDAPGGTGRVDRIPNISSEWRNLVDALG